MKCRRCGQQYYGATCGCIDLTEQLRGGLELIAIDETYQPSAVAVEKTMDYISTLKSIQERD
jgi:hypothetical protein